MGAAHGRYLPDLARAGDVEHVLRYGTAEEIVRLRYVAAAYLSGYAGVLRLCEHPHAAGRARTLRECYEAATAPARGDPPWRRDTGPSGGFASDDDDAADERRG